jgi:predicted nucleic acid-binding protein
VARPRTPFGGGVLVADTSAWARAHQESVHADWERALRGGQIATCAIVVLELLYSTRAADEYDRLAADLAHLRDVPIARSVTWTALTALGELAHAGPLHHRSVRLPDLLIAAAAADAGLGVLHYDRDFDTLATVLPFKSLWLAPAGSLS